MPFDNQRVYKVGWDILEIHFLFHQYSLVNVSYRLYNKVDVQNNILHTLREASFVGKKAMFLNLSFQAPPEPPLGLFGL